MAPRRGRQRRRNKPTPSQPDTPAVTPSDAEEPAGYDDGYQDGYGDGYEEGDGDGYEEGHEDGVMDADEEPEDETDAEDEEPEDKPRRRRRRAEDGEDEERGDEPDAEPAAMTPGGRYGKTIATLSRLKLSWVGVISALVALGGAWIDFREDMLRLDAQAVEIEREKTELARDAAEIERENRTATESMHDAIIELAESSVAMREEITALTGRLRWIEAQFGDQIMPYPPDEMRRLFGMTESASGAGGGMMGGGVVVLSDSGSALNSGAGDRNSASGHRKGRKVPGLNVELYEQRSVLNGHDHDPFADVIEVEGEEE